MPDWSVDEIVEWVARGFYHWVFVPRRGFNRHVPHQDAECLDALAGMGGVGEMQEADFRANQGDNFVPGLNWDARGGIWVDKQRKFCLPIFEFLRGIPKSARNPSCFSPTFGC